VVSISAFSHKYLEHNSKNDPKVFKLGIRNDLGIILEMTWFWVSGSHIRVKATAILQGFEL